jgi:hypothetical protein
METISKLDIEIIVLPEPGDFLLGDRTVTKFRVAVYGDGTASIGFGTAAERKADGTWSKRATYAQFRWSDVPDDIKAAVRAEYVFQISHLPNDMPEPRF